MAPNRDKVRQMWGADWENGAFKDRRIYQSHPTFVIEG